MQETTAKVVQVLNAVHMSLWSVAVQCCMLALIARVCKAAAPSKPITIADDLLTLRLLLQSHSCFSLRQALVFTNLHSKKFKQTFGLYGFTESYN